MKLTGHYYEFWITSSRGTDSTIIRRWRTEPTKEELKQFADTWIEGFGATHVSENHVSYGWRPLKAKDLPKNRTDALQQYQTLCDQHNKLGKRLYRARHLLAVYPFHGGRETQI